MGLLSGFAKQIHAVLVRPAERLNDYFITAVCAHVLHDDESARVAALAAGGLASKFQRSGMIAFLERFAAEARFATDVPEAPGSPGRQLMAAKLDSLAKQLRDGHWPRSDVWALRAHLAKIDPAYAAAFSKQDASVFSKRHPGLRLPQV